MYHTATFSCFITFASGLRFQYNSALYHMCVKQFKCLTQLFSQKNLILSSIGKEDLQIKNVSHTKPGHLADPDPAKKLIWIIFSTHSGSHTDDRTQMGVQAQLKCEESVLFGSEGMAFYDNTTTLGENTCSSQPESSHLLCAHPRQSWQPCSMWYPSPHRVGCQPPWLWQ